MTCIVGLVHEGMVYMGGDSAGVAGWDMVVRADAKVFTNGAFLFGFTSSFRMGQLLRYAFTPPDRDPRCSLDKYMATTFVDGVRACLKAGGMAETTNGAEKGGIFLVGHAGRIFAIMTDYQVACAADDFFTAGCGDQVASGALYVTRGRQPRERVQMALEAAERFSAGVRAPFIIETLAAPNAEGLTPCPSSC